MRTSVFSRHEISSLFSFFGHCCLDPVSDPQTLLNQDFFPHSVHFIFKFSKDLLRVFLFNSNHIAAERLIVLTSNQ
jgi:hypothetical protein